LADLCQLVSSVSSLLVWGRFDPHGRGDFRAAGEVATHSKPFGSLLPHCPGSVVAALPSFILWCYLLFLVPFPRFSLGMSGLVLVP
jgi:hypothetical protein